jgi:hypothetical protein
LRGQIFHYPLPLFSILFCFKRISAPETSTNRRFSHFDDVSSGFQHQKHQQIAILAILMMFRVDFSDRNINKTSY